MRYGYINMNVLNRHIKIALPLAGLLLLLGCSTRKNTFVNRSFHSISTKYNVLYNGQLAFEDGIKQLNDNYNDNYWELLPIEPLKVDELAYPGMQGSVDSSPEAFTKAEEKAVKAIQKHSMNFYGKEKNPQIDDAYLLLGKSRYYSQRFVPALEAFNYVIKNYPDANLIDETKIWQAKTNVRLQNEEVAILTLKALLKKKDLSEKNRFNAHTALAMSYMYADSIKQVIYQLKKSVNVDYSSEQYTRNLLILGQLYRMEKKIDSSNYAFNKIIEDKKAPFKYQINAHIEKAKNLEDSSNLQPMIQSFESLIKDRDNRSYLDKLHYHLALIHLKNKETSKAEEHLKKSVRAKNAERFQKVLSYEVLGDLQFNKGNYLTAGNYYDSVLNFTTDQNSKRYLRTKRIRKNLDDVILNEQLAKENDSILKLASMTNDERLEVINTIINELKSGKNLSPSKPVVVKNEVKSNVKTGKFYFYNPEIVKAGILEFQKKWGNRSLADNWRFEKSNRFDTNLTESTKDIDEKFTPEYYLSQIPTDEIALDSIKKVRNEAYYKLGLIYKEQFQRKDLAVKRFEKVLTFGVNEVYYLPSKYHLYRIYSEENNPKAIELRKEIIQNYPNSIYATLVQNTDKTLSLSDEDSPEKEYKRIYLQYEKEQYDEVLDQINKAIKKYGQTDLIAKFELLKAYTIGKKEGIPSFKNALEFVATTYPNTEEGKKAIEVINTIKNN